MGSRKIYLDRFSMLVWSFLLLLLFYWEWKGDWPIKFSFFLSTFVLLFFVDLCSCRICLHIVFYYKNALHSIIPFILLSSLIYLSYMQPTYIYFPLSFVCFIHSTIYISKLTTHWLTYKKTSHIPQPPVFLYLSKSLLFLILYGFIFEFRTSAPPLASLRPPSIISISSSYSSTRK